MNQVMLKRTSKNMAQLGVKLEGCTQQRLSLETFIPQLQPLSVNQSTLSAGFEPARGDPNGFLVHRLNHSATTTTVADFKSDYM